MNKKDNIKIDKRLKIQLKILDKATDMAIRQVEQERTGKDRDYIVEWFRYIEIASNKLSKYLN